MSCGRFWGHTGGVYGMRTYAFSSQDGRRQVALGSNLSGYERFGKDGKPVANPIDPAINAHLDKSLCGGVKKA